MVKGLLKLNVSAVVNYKIGIGYITPLKDTSMVFNNQFYGAKHLDREGYELDIPTTKRRKNK